MAVSGKGPAPREVPFALLNDIPDQEADGLALATKLAKFANFAQGTLAGRPVAGASQEGDFYWAKDDTTYGPAGSLWVLFGGKWELLPLPTVTTAMLVNLCVTTAKLAEECVTTAKIAALSVTEPKVGPEAIGTSKIKALAITAAKMAAEAIEAIAIKAGAVGTLALANLGVTTSKLAERAVTGAKIALSIIGDEHIAVNRALLTTSNAYGAPTAFLNGEEYEAHPTRMVFVTIAALRDSNTTVVVEVFVGGIKIMESVVGGLSEVAAGAGAVSFLVPPKLKWKVSTTATGSGALTRSYLTL